MVSPRIVTLTPGRTAPVSSVTTPRMLPVVRCAQAGAETQSRARATPSRAARLLRIRLSFQVTGRTETATAPRELFGERCDFKSRNLSEPEATLGPSSRSCQAGRAQPLRRVPSSLCPVSRSVRASTTECRAFGGFRAPDAMARNLLGAGDGETVRDPRSHAEPPSPRGAFDEDS